MSWNSRGGGMSHFGNAGPSSSSFGIYQREVACFGVNKARASSKMIKSGSEKNQNRQICQRVRKVVKPASNARRQPKGLIKEKVQLSLKETAHSKEMTYTSTKTYGLKRCQHGKTPTQKPASGKRRK